MAGKIVDIFLVYQFIRRLVTPFTEWEAYKLGIIDADGNVLKPRDSLNTTEKQAWGYFDVLVANLKKLLGKIPAGKSAIASYAAAILLLKEQNQVRWELVLNNNLLIGEFRNQLRLVEEEGMPKPVEKFLAENRILSPKERKDMLQQHVKDEYKKFYKAKAKKDARKEMDDELGEKIPDYNRRRYLRDKMAKEGDRWDESAKPMISINPRFNKWDDDRMPPGDNRGKVGFMKRLHRKRWPKDTVADQGIIAAKRDRMESVDDYPNKWWERDDPKARKAEREAKRIATWKRNRQGADVRAEKEKVRNMRPLERADYEAQKKKKVEEKYLRLQSSYRAYFDECGAAAMAGPPANNVGAGHIAGADENPPVRKRPRIMRRKRKINESGLGPRGKVSSPFAGGVKSKAITRKHKPLVWENMLGTVYAANPAGISDYFDYDWDKARAYAELDKYTDLRIARNPGQYNYLPNDKDSYHHPRKGQFVLWGIPKAKINEWID